MKKITKVLSSFILVGSLIGGSVYANASENEISINLPNTDIAKKQEILMNSIEPYLSDIREHGTLYFEDDSSSVSLYNQGKLIIAMPKQSFSATSKSIYKIQTLTSQQDVEIRSVDDDYYSSNKLFEVNNQIYENWDEYVKLGVEITSTFTDEKLDRVVIEAKSITDNGKKVLEDTYGNIIDIRVSPEFQGGVESVSRTGNNSVLGGGIAINGGSCTTTATVKRNTEKFILTAGHCISGDGVTAVNQNTTKVGVEWAVAGNGQDIGLIKVTDSNRKISNGYIRTSTTSYDGSFTGLSNNVAQGQTLYKTGITTGYTSSKVLSTSFTATISGVVRPDQIKLSNPNYSFQNNGDSGAPLFSLNTLYGIMSGKSSVTGADAWASATKIKNLGTYWPDYSLYTSSTDY